MQFLYVHTARDQTFLNKTNKWKKENYSLGKATLILFARRESSKIIKGKKSLSSNNHAKNHSSLQKNFRTLILFTKDMMQLIYIPQQHEKILQKGNIGMQRA